jgi:hypothetical protein
MAPIRSEEALALECSGCGATYLVARRATYEELELAEVWMETHGRCAFPRLGMAGESTRRPRLQPRWEEPFRREVEAALTKTVAQLPLLAAMLERRGARRGGCRAGAAHGDDGAPRHLASAAAPRLPGGGSQCRFVMVSTGGAPASSAARPRPSCGSCSEAGGALLCASGAPRSSRAGSTSTRTGGIGRGHRAGAILHPFARSSRMRLMRNVAFNKRGTA